MNPISVGVWTYGMGTDRYVGDGYKPKMELKDRIEHIGKQNGVSSIEITYPGDINEDNYEKYKPLLEKYNLSICAMGVELVCDKQWATGSFSSPVKEVRDKSVLLVKKAMDFAASIGTKTVCLWLGQDGFDYFFQTDYVAAWNNLIEGLQECADHNPDINLGIEYKVSEPRLKCMASSGGKTLAICQCTGRTNVGVCMDIGHSLNAGENPAETASMLISQNRLFHLHFNDNYLIADDDMPVGSVHYLHFMELFYWLKKLGYSGYYSLDMYPYRDNPDTAVEASVKFIQGMDKFIETKMKDITFSTEFDRNPSRILSSLFTKMFDL